MYRCNVNMICCSRGPVICKEPVGGQEVLGPNRLAVRFVVILALYPLQDSPFFVFFVFAPAPYSLALTDLLHYVCFDAPVPLCFAE